MSAAPAAPATSGVCHSAVAGNLLGQGTQIFNDLAHRLIHFGAGMLQLRRLQGEDFGCCRLVEGCGIEIGKRMLHVHDFLPDDILKLDGSDDFADICRRNRSWPGNGVAVCPDACREQSSICPNAALRFVQQPLRFFMLSRLHLCQLRPRRCGNASRNCRAF